MKIKWTPEILQFIKDTIAISPRITKYKLSEIVSKKFNINASYESLNCKMKAEGISLSQAKLSVADKYEDMATRSPEDLTAFDMKCINKQNEVLIKELNAEKYKTRMIVGECARSLERHMATLKLHIPKYIRPKGANTDMDMHILRSDMQIGQKVDPRFVSGMNEYSFETYKKELALLTEKVCHFYDQDTTSHGLHKFVMSYLGDAVEGDCIYKGQPFHIDRYAVDQVFEGAVQEVKSFVEPVFDHCNPEVIEILMVPGNHGRVSMKGMTPERDNWDYVFYKVMQMMLAPYADRIKCYVSDSPLMVMQHGDYVFCYTHGDNVVSWMNIPYYGLDRTMNRINTMFHGVDYLMVGHFHDPAGIGGRIFVNGSFVGGSNLSINKMNLCGRASQKMIYFHKKHGINRESDIYLADKVVLEKDSNNIFTPYS